MTMSRRLALFTPVAVLAMVTVTLGFSLTRDARVLPTMLMDRPLPAFSKPPVSRGEPGLSDADLKGRPALLNVFSSWCGGCRYEHPLLMRLAADGGVPIYGINWRDAPGAGDTYLKRFGNPYVRAGDDPNGRLGIDLGVTGVPETFLIDRTGRVRYRHAGPLTEEVWATVFRPMLAEQEKRQ